MPRPLPIRTRCALYTAGYVIVWMLAVGLADWLAWDALRASLALWGLGGLFLIGLAWVVWFVERASQHYAQRPDAEDEPRKTWNPLDVDAWYYGRRGKKLNQSLTALAAYSLSFLLAATLLSQLSGCSEIYEMPSGGGQQQTLAVQTVKLQKVIKKKFVINPFSAIVFNPPPIDEVKLQLTEVTQHAYTVGYGQGAGA